MAVAETWTLGLVSGEELERRPELEPCELIEGRIVRGRPVSLAQARIEAGVGHAKLEDYLPIGIDRVWVVDPRSLRVFTYRSLTNLQIVRPGEELTDPELLPGFSLAVEELFRG
ncbi:MAG TPA: Uma2 family endonuclease [Thermoanaerobaculia bacterium]|nr:Uma2 family endonuclease [Thermoanaerobaculia bacterium]